MDVLRFNSLQLVASNEVALAVDLVIMPKGVTPKEYLEQQVIPLWSTYMDSNGEIHMNEQAKKDLANNEVTIRTDELSEDNLEYMERILSKAESLQKVISGEYLF